MAGSKCRPACKSSDHSPQRSWRAGRRGDKGQRGPKPLAPVGHQPQRRPARTWSTAAAAGAAPVARGHARPLHAPAGRGSRPFQRAYELLDRHPEQIGPLPSICRLTSGRDQSPTPAVPALPPQLGAIPLAFTAAASAATEGCPLFPGETVLAALGRGTARQNVAHRYARGRLRG
jgi:hypothetical protein